MSFHDFENQTLGVFPSSLKLHKLELQTENIPNERTSILKRRPHIAKKKVVNLYFADSQKYILQNCIETPFFPTFTGHMTYHKSEKNGALCQRKGKE